MEKKLQFRNQNFSFSQHSCENTVQTVKALMDEVKPSLENGTAVLEKD